MNGMELMNEFRRAFTKQVIAKQPEEDQSLINSFFDAYQTMVQINPAAAALLGSLITIEHIETCRKWTDKLRKERGPCPDRYCHCLLCTLEQARKVGF